MLKQKITTGYFVLMGLLALCLLIPQVPEANADRTQTILNAGYFTSIGDAFSTIYYNAGYVSIGANASASSTLYVQGYAGSATSTLATASSSGAITFVVKSSGNTGVGTSTPRNLLSVAQGVTATTTIDLGERTCFNVGNTASSSVSFYFVGTTQVIENHRCN